MPLRRPWRLLRSNIIVWCRYGTTKPTAIRLPGCDYLVEINPNDRRAQKMLIRDGARGKVSKATKIWRALAAHLQPTLVIDVGLNYGECMLGTTYGPDCRMIGFEANPGIFTLLERSIRHHPNHSQITLHNVLVSGVSGGSQPFFVDPDWSGTATAVRGLHNSPGVLVHELAVSSLDDRIPVEASDSARCLFKIDIEGYESKAMAGFIRTLDACRVAVGLIEFDSHFLSVAGTDPAVFLSELQEVFDVYHATDLQGRELQEVRRLEDVPSPTKSDRRHTDLILVKRNTCETGLFPPQFTIARAS
ncbi:FkbM family methyltransferase [Luteolibacter yonseiensis]|uniref:FkbM family methyltransferase n=2 Tax=Luteolibacter yonseiensis TaxID=1144680 RepID=A0A934V997_9BACT|nr:FkbM family methyltransferase [Luteolibacter yonseiensis]MBK1814913.1 FkbM family methyltransferase [Luteolibacter yonseiensis]